MAAASCRSRWKQPWRPDVLMPPRWSTCCIRTNCGGTAVEEGERNTIAHRIKEAHLPRVKTLEEFDYTQSPNVSAAKMRELAEGGYLERAEPILFIGECGTGKTH